MLIEDMVQYTLADFKGKGNRPGYQPTKRWQQDGANGRAEPELQSYCEVLRKVLKAAYGQDKSIGTVILSETAQSKLPVRMVGVYLNDPSLNMVEVVPLESQQLRHRLLELHKMAQDSENPHVIYQRCIRTYEAKQVQGAPVLLVHIIKPDQVRYWTRSMALRDGDEIAADLMVWGASSTA
jgi:hypothetical protein